jgi:glycosyltransferase involved in cell wall biosynthesis
MNIGMLLDKNFYGDLRVENEVQALSSAGFKVFVYCFTFKGKYKIDDYYGAKIVHIPVSKKIVYKLRGLTNTILNLYPVYLTRLITKYLIEHKIEVLHIHDLFLFEAGLKIKEKLSNIILVGDLHENYVEGLKSYKFANTFPGNLLISIKKWQNSEIEWCNKFDYLVTVIEEAVSRYSSLGISAEKMYVVSNYVNLDTFRIDNPNPAILSKFNNFKTLTYVGGFDSHRGLENAIKAVPAIVDKISDFKLVLVGEGRNFSDLKLLAKELNVENFISFEGWQSHTLLSSYIEASKICLIPHLKTGHTDNTIPHKLFQYMLLKKPILSSNCNPIERIVNETESGRIYKFNDHLDLATKAIDLFNDKNILEQMGVNGKTAVNEKYNWNETSKNLITLYSKIKKRLDEI